MPINASLSPDGGRPILNKEGDLRLPCGKCSECISKRSMEWSLRCKHEISQHESNCFITLTYNDDNLNDDEIYLPDMQKFLKRLRKKIHPQKIRYIYSGEYGSNTARPHFHAIIFGWEPDDQTFLKETDKGNTLFDSKTLSKLWGLGNVSIGTANERTSYYIASYALKGGKKNLLDPETGELKELTDLMRVSKNPGIGLNYLKLHYKQLIDSNTSLPRYYIKKLEEIDPDYLEIYENKQLLLQQNRGDYQKFAKFVIDEQKLNMDSEFRAFNPSPEDKVRKSHLKHAVEFLDAHNRKKENT